MKTALTPLITALLLLTLTGTSFANSLKESAHWSGTVRVEGQLVVEEKVVLTIEPGTTVEFLPGKLDEEGLADCGMLVKGSVIAVGQPGSRITFTSGADSPKPGDWGELKLFGSVGSAFTDCDFRYGGWGLHVHESELKIDGCTFTKNSYGGIRLKGGQIEITGCSIRGMGIGIRYWKGAPSIHNNLITGNDTGIFCRQDGGGSSISFNNIYGNTEYNIKLGDGQKEDIDARNNWWGTTDTGEISLKLYDKSREDYIGKVEFVPYLKEAVKSR